VATMKWIQIKWSVTVRTIGPESKPVNTYLLVCYSPRTGENRQLNT
jgi:hypothetical protein